MSGALAVQLREWERRSPTGRPGDPLAGFRLVSAADRELAARFTRVGVLTLRELSGGLEIESRSHVGKLRLGPLTITITPKLGGEALVRLFRYAYGLRDLKRVDAAPFAHGGSLFEDLIPAQLLTEAEELLSAGLDRRYVTVAELLTSPRGRIDIDRIAREGGVTRGTLPCRHHLRLEDCLLNQVLLAGLNLAAGVAASPGLKVALHRLAVVLAARIRARPLHRQLVAQVRQGLDRMAKAYEPALTLISLLLDGEAPELAEGAPALQIPGFLLDMNRFFQALLGRFLRENLDGCHVQEEQSIDDLLRYAPGANPRRRHAPRPRPDFVVTSADGRKSILDAKYRDLWERELPREMLYQLALYALSQPKGKATILYPTSASETQPARIEIREPLGGWDRASVVLQPVDLVKLDQIITAGHEGAMDRKAMARELAGLR